MKKIGVVVPVYNVEAYLQQCVDSILNQTFDDFELVLVDDGSIDTSGEICDEYKKRDSRIKVIHQINKGKLAARFEGVKACSAEYISFVDADDWISPKTYEIIESHLNGINDAVFFQIIRWHNDAHHFISETHLTEGIITKHDIEKIYGSMIWDNSANSFGIDPSLCNKIFLYKHIYNELSIANEINVGYGDDVAVTYPLLAKIDNIMVLNQPFYYHRQRHDGQIADYLTDPYFYNKLARLYDYLCKRFEYEETYVKQLDCFFAYSARYRLLAYGNDLINNRYRYMFPFECVEKGARIVLYGAAEKGQEYAEQIKRTNYATVVKWVDKNYRKFLSLGVCSPEEIRDTDDFDYIVYAVKSREVYEQIENCFTRKIPYKYKNVWRE